MEIAKVFQTGRSQAVRLPKAFRFNGTEVVSKASVVVYYSCPSTILGMSC